MKHRFALPDGTTLVLPGERSDIRSVWKIVRVHMHDESWQFSLAEAISVLPNGSAIMRRILIEDRKDTPKHQPLLLAVEALLRGGKVSQNIQHQVIDRLINLIKNSAWLPAENQFSGFQAINALAMVPADEYRSDKLRLLAMNAKLPIEARISAAELLNDPNILVNFLRDEKWSALISHRIVEWLEYSKQTTLLMHLAARKNLPPAVRLNAAASLSKLNRKKIAEAMILRLVNEFPKNLYFLTGVDECKVIDAIQDIHKLEQIALDSKINIDFRDAAAWKLMQLNSPKAPEILMEIALDMVEEPLLLRSNAPEKYTQLLGQVKAISQLIDLVKHSNSQRYTKQEIERPFSVAVRRTNAKWLTIMSGSDRSVNLSMSALRTLAQIGEKEIVFSLGMDKTINPSVRQESASIFWQWGEEKSATKIFTALFKDVNTIKGIDIDKICHTMVENKNYPALLELLRDEKSDDLIRLSVCNALEGCFYPGLNDELDRICQGMDSPKLKHAIQSIIARPTQE